MKNKICKYLILIIMVVAIGNIVFASGADTTLGENSAYTLIEVDEPGANVITKYIYDSMSGEVTPVYYEVSLNKTTYGEGDNSLTFTVNGINGGTYEIEAHYDSNKTYAERQTSLSGDITESFIGIDSYYSASSPGGGAIYSGGSSSDIKKVIEDITADFIGNSFSSDANEAYGGAIYNQKTIENISGDFIGNYLIACTTGCGGAICNYGTSAKINSITGSFIGNYIIAGNQGSGGAIYNSGTIDGDVTCDFIGNYTIINNISSAATSRGGAIYNSGTINGGITGDFIANYIVSSSTASNNNIHGGAIYNNGTISGGITGDFIGNYIIAENKAYGGAICNFGGTISAITGDFIANYIIAENTVYGGAIYNTSTIETVTGDFISNYIQSNVGSAYGGALSNIGSNLGNIEGNFIGNCAQSNTGNAMGGAVYNNKTISTIEGNFINNHAESTDGNARGGAIYNSGTMTVNGNITDNYAESTDGNAQGGAIYNSGTITLNNTYIKGLAESENGEAQGGAIYTTGTVNLNADDGYEMVFDGNKTISSGEEDDNAIYAGSEDAVVNLNLTNDGKLILNDNIDGVEGYTLNLTGDESGTAYINNDIKNADITHENITSYLSDASYLNNNNSLNMSSGTMNIAYMGNETVYLRDFSITNGNIVIDTVAVDLENETMGHFEAGTASYSGDGSITVNGMTLVSDTEKNSVSIFFAQENIMNSVISNVSELPDTTQSEIYAPIYKYTVNYETRENEGGYFTFTRSGGSSSDSFNPAVLVSSVASQLGAYTALTTTYEYAFEHSNYYMKLPNATRLAMQNGNKYAITETNNTIYQSNEMTDRGMWYRPYTSFESANLKRGPKVDAINYGTLIGGDSDFKEYKNGWGGVFSAYVGYNGSSLSYSGVHTYQNGGLLGVTQTFYKNNFFTALTATAGASVGEASTMYGHENFTMLMAGVASKTGYNLEFKEGRFIVQPSLLLSYSFINTFDYRNAAGVRINSDPLHAIEINPNIRFVMNCRNGWQPYASVGMIWNILDETKVTANNVTLPEMSIRPYVEYGLGIQRLWNDKYGGYLQAMIRNGGRNGVVLTAGFRFKFGKEPKSVKNINGNAISERKVIKQLTPANTVSERKVIKQL